MGFFGSWWERLRSGELVPLLVTAMMLGLTLSRAGYVLRHLALPSGNYWT
jgi:hypothetical protein